MDLCHGYGCLEIVLAGRSWDFPYAQNREGRNERGVLWSKCGFFTAIVIGVARRNRPQPGTYPPPERRAISRPPPRPRTALVTRPSASHALAHASIYIPATSTHCPANSPSSRLPLCISNDPHPPPFTILASTPPIQWRPTSACPTAGRLLPERPRRWRHFPSRLTPQSSRRLPPRPPPPRCRRILCPLRPCSSSSSRRCPPRP